jgi:hypothetical protein
LRNHFPRRLEDSAQGFNPGNHPTKRFALKDERIWNEFQLRHMTTALSVRIVNPLYIALPSGRVALDGRSPGLKSISAKIILSIILALMGLKPWAESCSPFGAIFGFAY